MAGSHATCLVDTADLDDARTLIGASYCDHRIDVQRPRRPFHAVLTEIEVGSIAVHRLRYGADVVVSASPLRRAVLVTSPVRGRLTVTIGRARREVLAGDVVALGPDREFSLSWSDDCELSTVRLRRDLVDAAAQELGSPPGSGLDFDLRHRIADADRERWHRLVALLEVDAGSDRSVAASPLLSRRMEDLVAGTVVRGHPVEGSPAPATLPSATPHHVRLAVEHLHAHADQPVTLTSLAHAVGASPRGLQAGFRRHLGTTPMRFLRELRMHRARADLLRADPASGSTVADVAYAWGFGNLGRFARDYRAEFGELPSLTLRR